MEVNPLSDLETKSFSIDWKAIPKKYIIAGCILLVVIIILVIAYHIGKKKTEVNHAKPDIQETDFEEIEEAKDEPDREDLDEKVISFLGKEDYTEHDIIQLDMEGKLSWQEACRILNLSKSAYFRHKSKYKQNG